MMKQNTITPDPSQTKKPKRIGRGNGSGHGTFSGRGMKGQKARAGGIRRPGFEGGQTPLIRKMPKMRGFTHPFAKQKSFQVINLSDLEATFNDGDTVTVEILFEKGLISKLNKAVKLLGHGTLSKKLEIDVDAATQSVFTAVEKAGGKITVVTAAEAESKE